MPTIKTDASVRAAKTVADKQIEYRVDGVRGLALRVSAEGKKTWTLRYRTLTGEQRRQTIGTYPEVGLADARNAAEIALGKVAAGGDPAKDRRAQRAAAKARKLSTVADLIEAYLEASEKGRHRANALPKRRTTIANERHYFDRLIKPRFGKRAIAELTRSEVQRFVDEIDAKSPSMARLARNVIRQAYNYAIGQEAVDRNPAQLTEVTRRPSRERVLTDGEVRAIWNVLDRPEAREGLDVGPMAAAALQLTALTLQRGGEVVGLHARELDRAGKLWILPGDRTKNHRPHVVPLSASAVKLLDQAFGKPEWSGYAFPSPRGRRPMTRHALSRAMKRITTALSIADATPHDLRRTGATAMTGERIGVQRFIVSRVLNQISDTGGAAAVTGIYDRNEYLVEKRRALDAWAALLAEVVSGTSRANVVPMKRA
jgi:integrase